VDQAWEGEWMPWVLGAGFAVEAVRKGVGVDRYCDEHTRARGHDGED
jgi:hypothetical protein